MQLGKLLALKTVSSKGQLNKPIALDAKKQIDGSQYCITTPFYQFHID